MSWLDFLRIDKWQRPERSGALAICAVYMVLCFAAIPFEYKGDDGLPSLSCTMMPFLPHCLEQEKHEEAKKYDVIPIAHLIYCPKCKVRKQKMCWKGEVYSREEIPIREIEIPCGDWMREVNKFSSKLENGQHMFVWNFNNDGNYFVEPDQP